MKIVLLDKNTENTKTICKLINKKISDCECISYKTPMSFVIGVHDELNGDVDLMIIHIENDEDENIMLAEDVQKYFPHIKLFFYSENDISADVIYNAVPSYFFKMPIVPEKIFTAIERIEKTIFNENEDSIQICKNKKIIKIRYESIDYIESVGRKLFIYSNDGYYNVNMTIRDVLDKLPDYFYQCHRSYIINLKKITALDVIGVGIKDKSIVPVSKTYRHELEKIVRGENAR